MDKTLRHVICQTTAQHLNMGHLVAGQCLRAVGNVGNTVPERDDLTELPCSDVAGAYFVVGMALAGKRPMLILRYQGFSWFAASAIVNYAAKSKEIWGRPCPMLIRAISNEGGIGPVAGSSHHSLFLRMPGVKIFSPMTPNEWKSAYDEFMSGDDVVFLSEHRGAWGNDKDLKPKTQDEYPDIVLFPISITRFAVREATDEIFWRTVIHDIYRIKSFSPSEKAIEDLKLSRFGGIVIDDDYPDGTAKALALDLHNLTGAKMHVLGLEDRTAGFSTQTDNLPPNTEKIKSFIRSIITV